MSMSVRAKLAVAEVVPHEGGAKTVRLHAVYDDTIPEDRRFAAATPSGKVELYIDNPAAAAFFEQNSHVYLDFTPAETRQPEAADAA